jgi:hypothetical protein
MDTWQNVKSRAALYFAQFDETDLRWSYLIIAAGLLVCTLVNWFFRDNHGWTVWPFAAGIAIMVLINEAADRAGQGVPPLQVYAFFIGAMVVWLGTMILLSAINPLIIVAGMGGLFYYCGRGYVEGRRREQLIAGRVAEGLCVHCGEPADYSAGYCEHCFEDPNPSATQLARVQAVALKSRDPARMRATIKQESFGASASRKEQALLARRRAGKPRR